ncbi:lysophosphatidic acid receptor 6-like [Cheilinus undulatus]|uniref:lysophosphatidic acid receptor 6-like n=1 Tax=Cheilinus undulatus TaxID=241271 RepID=UPI001BD2EC44|nr:lysophosphatidic acid receptor 6-like [Cheilinus undulatus]
MNTTLEEGPEPAYAAIFGCILAVGLPLNAVSLWILLRHHSLKSPSAVYMVNLAISDLLLAISLPLRVYFYATGTWPLSVLACHSVSMLFRNNIRSSALFITIISVDRLLAVVYPLRSRHRRTSSNAWKAAALIWLFVIVTNVPESVKYFIYLNNTNQSSCFKNDGNSKSIMIYLQPVLVFSMLAVNIVCTALVSWTLNRHLNDSTRINNKVYVMLIFVMSLVMFIVCFLPLYGGLLVKTTSEEIKPLVCLASVNCCLDPLLYYFSFDAFWKKKDNADLPG